jgi:DNA invertase Pin-like site-specific DNA recombinase
MNEKIKAHHLERKAILYIRQSTTYQVSNNLENQKLQLRAAAAPVGWLRDRSWMTIWADRQREQ